MKTARAYRAAIIFCLFLQPARAAEILLLEPNIQGNYSGDIVPAVMAGGRYFLDVIELSDSLKFRFDNHAQGGEFLGRDFDLHGRSSLDISGRKFYEESALEKALDIQMNVDAGEMVLNVDSSRVLPTTRQIKNMSRARKIRGPAEYDSFANYEFDERYFSFPQMDFIYGFNQTASRRGGAFSDYYQANFSMLAGGLDMHATIFGDDEIRTRINASRTLLDEPGNRFNLVQFQAGDIISNNQSMFINGAGGRGVAASSFKDFVISASKTIDISGPMAAGWQAELYLNNQLIGFRQGEIDGNYEFKSIPVGYGLNDFEVVLYGPFGEIVRVPRRYYSGTAPVRSGEFGYSVNAFQANRFLIEANEKTADKDNHNITADSMFYYGASDMITLIWGLTATDYKSQFGTAGLQLALDGVSLQYNANHNLSLGKTGHHFEAQGNIYIGDIFSRYDYYGKIDSPVSFAGGRHLRDLFESRLVGVLPAVQIPYFISYLQSRDYNNLDYMEIRARLSPNWMRFYNISVENVYARRGEFYYDDINVLAQVFAFGKLRLNFDSAVQVYPASEFSHYGAAAEYRWDKNTFIRAKFNHNFHSDLDSVSLGMGRLFAFGGLTATATADTAKNLSFGLRYNISVGKVPGEYDAFTNAETQMTNYGTIAIDARDQEGRPVSGADIIVSGRSKIATTDEFGRALITDIAPYQKVMLNVDASNMDDIALTPEFEQKKIVLRPGVVRPIEVQFVRRGGVDGQLVGMNAGETYKISMRDEFGGRVASTATDSDGSFIFDGLPYGEYVLSVARESGREVFFKTIVINQSFHSITTPFEL